MFLIGIRLTGVYKRMKLTEKSDMLVMAMANEEF